VSEIEFCTLYVVAERWILGCILHAKNHFSDTLSVCPAFSLNVYRTYDTLGRFVGQWVCSGPAAPACSGGSQIYGTSSGWKGSQLLNQADTVLNQQVSYSYLPPVPAKYRRGSRRVRRASPSCLRASLVCVRKGRQEKVDRRNVHPYPLRVSGDIVPSGPRGFPNGTKPFASAPTIDLVRPLSLTEELRLCQNIEHYNYRYECRVPQASIHRHDARVPSTKIE
jgi:hypothetical protein